MLVLSDEVYEHVVYDGAQHHSVLSHPELARRSFAVFSFGKTLHATGLRIGYCVAPAHLTQELRKVHQFNTFSIAHPLQQAIAGYLAEKPAGARGLAPFFQAKRDRLRAALAQSGFVLPPAQGTYFQLLDFGALSQAGDLAFAERLLTAGGRRHDTAFALLRSAAATALRAPVHRQAGRDSRCRGGAPEPVRAATWRGGGVSTLRVSLVQQPLLWQDPAGNRAHFAACSSRWPARPTSWCCRKPSPPASAWRSSA